MFLFLLQKNYIIYLLEAEIKKCFVLFSLFSATDFCVHFSRFTMSSVLRVNYFNYTSLRLLTSSQIPGWWDLLPLLILPDFAAAYETYEDDQKKKANDGTQNTANNLYLLANAVSRDKIFSGRFLLPGTLIGSGSLCSSFSGSSF